MKAGEGMVGGATGAASSTKVEEVREREGQREGWEANGRPRRKTMSANFAGGCKSAGSR